MLISNWNVPLPLEQYLNHRVVIYYFSDGQWIPIKYCRLSKAIEIYQRTKHEVAGETLVFPVDLNPNAFKN
ncbi:hypothetical protein [Calothrix sp. NIES-2098]|uniref:hypothetical protein n=1 Tax=Calothrix sp. NIES-2098 TaxID=1954171 RepID=UPI000B621A49|nr:hypothetical protein NIES2098_08490 [Calothrix sp. NIES-2098]